MKLFIGELLTFSVPFLDPPFVFTLVAALSGRAIDMAEIFPIFLYGKNVIHSIPCHYDYFRIFFWKIIPPNKRVLNYNSNGTK